MAPTASGTVVPKLARIMAVLGLTECSPPEASAGMAIEATRNIVNRQIMKFFLILHLLLVTLGYDTFAKNRLVKR